jgi:alpha-beta hydrolase superfamily lysophospholipase
MDAQTRQTYLDAAAALAAADFDDAVGQYALANETALRFVMQTHPAIPERPLVIVGCSFGAIMSPTVAARLTASGLRPEAVVLIGGGTNFLKIAGSSWMDYYYSRVRGLAAAELHLTVNERKIVTAGYLERSTLDPYHTAPGLRNEKVLILHASMDDIVPASTGDDLWDRAGRPERWIGNFGHLFMFAALPWKVDDISDWLDRAVAGSDSHSDGRGDEP